METMKAITVYAPNDAKMEDVKKPVAIDDMMVVKVFRTGVCATDLSIYSGESSFIRSGEITLPCRFGHEWAGIVESVGENVKNFKPGDRVYCDNFVSCGKCDACKEGRYIDCKDICSVGTVNCWDGCYAEYMAMPERHVFRLPDELSMDEGALIEPASIAYDAFKGANLDSSKTAVVIGTGAIGMISAWLAKYYGAGKVILIGRNDSKMEISKKVGVDYVINNRNENAVERVKELTGGKGANMIIETSGAESAFLQCIDMVARFGRISVVSFYEKELNNIPIDKLVLGCISVVGAAGRDGNAQGVCEIMCKNPIKLTPVISHHVPFENSLDVFENLSKYNNEKIKIMIDFD